MKLELQEIRLGLAAGLVMAVGAAGVAGAQSDEHGRKYKPMPATAHIVITVKKGFNDKPMPNAAVVFHAVRDGKNDGNLEVKTDEEGRATIDVIEMGSHLTVQVIAPGYATLAQEFDVTEPNKELEVKMLRPRAQISKYQEDEGKPAVVKPALPIEGTPADTTPMQTPPAAPSSPAPSSPK